MGIEKLEMTKIKLQVSVFASVHDSIDTAEVRGGLKTGSWQVDKVTSEA